MPHLKDKIIEIGELKSILSSQVLRRILQRSKVFQQAKVNENVRKQDWNNATYFLGRLDYIDKLGDIVQQEYDKLTKEKGD